MSLDEGWEVERDLQPDCSSETLARILRVPHAFLLRRSVDARHKDDVHFVCTVGIGAVADADAPQAIMPLLERPVPSTRVDPDGSDRPVVVGAGPAGLFAALELAEVGRAPLLIERGEAVNARRGTVDRFHANGILDPESNALFGEGGAGTFSDGKLTSGTGSPYARQVLETFVAAGAQNEIRWQARPHIGTDVLQTIIGRFTERICACGGEVRFNTRLVDFETDGGGRVSAAVVAPSDAPDQRERLATGTIILACGHSARDTFALLKGRGLELARKPFSLGVRIEHSQCAIDEARYGAAASHPALGAADYKLSCQTSTKRGVYTFCMCPGGEVVAAASEGGGLCVNGMSSAARDGDNANAALLCSVYPSDYDEAADADTDPDDPLAGIAFQRRWERAAFAAGGGDWRAPAQTVGDFCGREAVRTGATAAAIHPTYPFGVKETSLEGCLPRYVTDALRESFTPLDRKLYGFAAPGALLTGVETRSSSPVRVVRDKETLQASRVAGLYPCGEGSGYAGGIMTSAVDGIRCARAVLERQES
ncbi:MAG: FAD-dependent oxidoreductase [Coriobacteriaceae bacterium]|nr:FAD-dependent oxidoreductase [Coriobacteriaceae bacterium]